MEKKTKARKFGETLTDAKAKMWYISKGKTQTFLRIEEYICKKLRVCVEECSQDRNNERKRAQARAVLDELFDSDRIPSTVTYLKYDAGQNLGAPAHRDVDSVYGTTILSCKTPLSVVCTYKELIF